MKLVEPTTRTTLLLNRHFMAFSFCTARAAMRHLVTGRIKGMDADGNIMSWDGSDLDTYPTANTLSWESGNITLFIEHPYLRSAPNPITGKESRKFIPTVAVCSHHFGFHSRKKEGISIKALYSTYKGICQYCLNHISLNQATKDHVYPKEKGGSNHDFNLVLACRKCNNTKDNTFPFYNVKGKEVKPKKMLSTGVPVPDSDNIREEWKAFLFMS